MNCANPACGCATRWHPFDGQTNTYPCLICRRCADFVTAPPAPSREPLLSQLDAVIRTRAS